MPGRNLEKVVDKEESEESGSLGESTDNMCMCWYGCRHRLHFIGNLFISEDAVCWVNVEVSLKKEFGKGGDSKTRFEDSMVNVHQTGWEDSKVNIC